MRIVKEIFIMCLLCLAIVIILGVLFYEYIPSAQTFPKPLKYEKDENIVEILKETETTTNTQIVLKSYNINQDDLNLYKQQDYDAGKTNPFAAYSAQSDGSEQSTGGSSQNSGGSSSSNSSSSSSSSSSASTSSSSTGTFFEQAGSK